MGLSLQEEILLFQQLAGAAEQNCTLLGDRKWEVSEAEICSVLALLLPHPHTLHAVPRIASRARKWQRQNWCEVLSCWGRRSKTLLMTTGKGRGFCQLFFQEDGKLEGTPQSWVRKLTSNRRKRKTAHRLQNEIICDPVSWNLKNKELEVCFCGSSSSLDLRSSNPQNSPSP